MGAIIGKSRAPVIFRLLYNVGSRLPLCGPLGWRMHAAAVSDKMLDAQNPQYLQKNACGFFACANAKNAIQATANAAIVFLIVEFI